MSCDPDLCVRIGIGNVVEQVRSGRVEEGLLQQCFCQARRRARLTTKSVVEAITHGVPSPSDSSTTAREEQVVLGTSVSIGGDSHLYRTFSLSLFDVDPSSKSAALVPLSATTIVELSSEAKMCPRMPFSIQPKESVCVA